MKSILHEQKTSSVAAALITIILGVVLVGWPDRSIGFLCMLLGIAIVVTGVIYILGWVSRRREGVPAFFVLPGVILCALGVWLMTSPDSVVMLIQYIFGTILIFHGLVDIQGAVALMGRRWNRWWLDLLLAVLTIGLGVLILFNPFGTFATLVILIGVALVFDGISDLYIIFRLTRAFRAVADEDAQETPEQKSEQSADE